MGKVRVQVILDSKEKARFQRHAEREGESLSSWLRRSGQMRLAAAEEKRPWSVEELRAFFDRCERHEPGREPDWSEHLDVIDASIRSGTGNS